MAAVNNLVTLGIGPASDVKYLVTGGLEIGAAAAVDPVRQGQFAPEHRSRRHKVFLSCDPSLV